jgi:ABC-2 type transport system permease protein
MSDLALIGNQVRYEQKSYWRNPGAAFFTFAFPLVFFFILVGTAGHGTDASQLGAGVKLAQYYTPSILSYAVMSACFLSIAMTVVRQREFGILKRMRGTPLPAWGLIGGLIGSAMIVATLLSVVCITFGIVAYSVKLPASNIPAVVVTIALAALAFCALGIAVSSLIPNLDAGPAIINLPFFVLVFVSGTYFPISGTMAKIADYLPLRPFIVALYKPFDPTNTGSAWSPHQLAILAVWGIAATVFAVRHFRWTPRSGVTP